MNRKNYIPFAVLSAGLIMLTGCGKTIEEASSVVTGSKAVTSSESSAADSSSADPAQPKKFDKTEIKGTAVKYSAFSAAVEAEDCKLNGGIKKGTDLKGFSGKGYASGISSKDKLTAEVELNENQYYNVTLTVSGEEAVKCVIGVNGEKVSEFTVGGDSAKGKFVEVSFNNLLLEKGRNTFEISAVDEGTVSVDKVEVTASGEVEGLDLSLKDPALSNKNADIGARTLYDYLCKNFGKKVILGQHDSVGGTVESQFIYENTGKNPAIRFGDMSMFTDPSYTEDNEIPSALGWAKDGGIVAYMWHWSAPSGGSSCYSEETKFDISKAVTKEDISMKNIEELEDMRQKGKISKECLELVKDIDSISKQLALLRDDGVPVIWRPLHEASNGYFWWGKDEASYKWLWELMYKRQTNYHKLDNLIWVWSAQNAGWYVGDKMCDILSADVYDNGTGSGQINSMLFLRSISKTKPIAMSECGAFPEIQSIADENAMWSFICQWGGNFLITEEGSLNEENNTAEALGLMYNNNLVVTREDLPDFAKQAKALQAEEKKKAAQAAKKKTAVKKTSTKTSKAKKTTVKKTSAKKST